MKNVPVRDAKANFSKLVEAAERNEPTIVTKHGRAVAMLVSIEDGRKLHPAAPQPNFVEHLMSIPCEIPLPSRDDHPIRDVGIFTDPVDAAAE